MSERGTVGELVCRFLEACGITAAFGVISIHNLPILDAIGQRGKIRFVPSRGEAGAGNMADAFARVTGGPGVFFTSTGTAAGNAAGAMVEAQTAGTPLLHITGQIETRYLDRDWAYIHEARDQLTMLRSVSKAAFRIADPATALDMLVRAFEAALTPPAGPVSIEIPIDVQSAPVELPDRIERPEIAAPVPDEAALDRVADALLRARRPLIWCGGGARNAGPAVRRLADMGFGIVTSAQGRGIIPEDDPRSLGAFTLHDPVPDLYGSCDAMLVAGSRLRGNETLKYTLPLPSPLCRIDADPGIDGKGYEADVFVHGDARLALEGLAQRLDGRASFDPALHQDVAAARKAAEDKVLAALGPYARLTKAVSKLGQRDFVWVRDVTILNSTWGNRLPCLQGPRDGVHAVGGGIGQGLPMAIGASVGSPGRKTLCLVGDGGLQLNVGELATAAQENADILFLVMNSRDYGVIKNIQDSGFGGRHYYAEPLAPDFADLCRATGIAHSRVTSLDAIDSVLLAAHATCGPAMIEIDMAEIGDFASAFAGPPVARQKPAPVR